MAKCITDLEDDCANGRQLETFLSNKKPGRIRMYAVEAGSPQLKTG
jgi:hypothetical protein